MNCSLRFHELLYKTANRANVRQFTEAFAVNVLRLFEITLKDPAIQLHSPSCSMDEQYFILPTPHYSLINYIIDQAVSGVIKVYYFHDVRKIMM